MFNPISFPKYNSILTNPQSADLSRSHKAAPMPDQTGSGRDVFPGQGSGGYENTPGQGKGGHEPKTLGENKGLGSLPGH
jgi:hypothetical protein